MAHRRLALVALVAASFATPLALAATPASDGLVWSVSHPNGRAETGTGVLPHGWPRVLADLLHATPPLGNVQPPGVLVGAVEHMYVARNAHGTFLYHRAEFAGVLNGLVEQVTAQGYAEGFHRCAEPFPEPCPGYSGELGNWVGDHSIALYGNVTTFEARVPNDDGSYTVLGFATTFGGLVADGPSSLALVHT